MHDLNYLPDILILLAVSIINVVLSRRLKLSPVLGYLVLGATIGEYGLGLIKEATYAQNLSEFGVVFLLFVIGLELTFERLIQMRLHVFGYGGLQIALSTVAIGFTIQHFYSLDATSAYFIGCALSFSSTAIVLQVLSENKRQSSQVGRLSLATLLMQDFVVVPLLAILPLISSKDGNLLGAIGVSALKAFIAIILITIAGRIFLRPFFGVIGSAKSEEVYVTTTLLIVLGASTLTAEIGLSSAMGAFVAGILIAETEYRNRVESNILPFKSLFLGLFFLSVGMSINVEYILSQLSKVWIAALLLIVIKSTIIFLLCKAFRFRFGAAMHSSFLLSQGSEFAFILFSLAVSQKILPAEIGQFLLVVVAISMAVTPLLSAIGIWIEDRFDAKEELDQNQEFKGVSDLDSHIIIAGFGRVGRVIAHMLAEEKFNYVAVDSDLQVVKKARSQGFPVYHGDLSNLDVLRAVGAERAVGVVLTMTDRISLRKAVKTIYSHYKDLEIISGAEDYKHGHGLRKLGADKIVPSTIETGLQLGGALLGSLGITDMDIIALKEKFRNNNYAFTEEIELFRGLSPSKSNQE